MPAQPFLYVEFADDPSIPRRMRKTRDGASMRLSGSELTPIADPSEAIDFFKMLIRQLHAK